MTSSDSKSIVVAIPDGGRVLPLTRLTGENAS
jgi:hypothetical protein